MALPDPQRSENKKSEDGAAEQRYPWVPRMIEEMRKSDPKAAKFPHIEFRGAPHKSPKTDDSYHATVVLRKDATCRGTGMSLHVYPDGTIKPSRERYSEFKANAASAEELGEETNLVDDEWQGN
ncbi:hypothetical protein E4U48_005712 [Claviceps purpurea]|nr:hypothetical protein E4U25_005279 [Claviceps purpurea]KAG6265995.1 hypothetical protein E4U48_005712 [Claviceps purpurea]